MNILVEILPSAAAALVLARAAVAPPPRLKWRPIPARLKEDRR